MKKSIHIASIAILTGMILINAGCLTEMFGGAAGGALSASFVGATTDLILHGKVNTDTLARNATSGAIAGGMAGGAYGHQKNKNSQPKAQPSSAKADAEATKQLTKKIGKDNVEALEALLYADYETAYKKTLKSVNSSKKEYQEAGYVIQALIDTDRKNSKGVDASLNEFIKLNDKTNDLKAAQKGLKELYKKFLDMRKIKGI